MGARTDREHFKALSKAQILKFILSDKIKPFASDFCLNFKDLLELEFRVRHFNIMRARGLFAKADQLDPYQTLRPFPLWFDPNAKNWKIDLSVQDRPYFQEKVLLSFALQTRTSSSRACSSSATPCGSN